MSRSGAAAAKEAPASSALGSGLESTYGVQSLRAETKRYGRDLALDLVVERIAALRQVSGAAIAVRSGEDFRCLASAGIAPPVGSLIHPSEGLSGECIRSANLVYCADAIQDERVDTEIAEDLGLRSVLIVPVNSAEEMAALIEAFSPEPQRFGTDAQAVFQELAVLVGELIQRPDVLPRPRLVDRVPTVTNVATTAPEQNHVITPIADLAALPIVHVSDLAAPAIVFNPPSPASVPAIPEEANDSRSMELLACLVGVMALAAVFLSFWLIRPHLTQTATKPSKIVVTTPDNVKPPAPAVTAIENETPVQPARDASRVRSNQPRSTEDSPISDEPISVAQKPSLLSTNKEAAEPTVTAIAPNTKLALPIMAATPSKVTAAPKSPQISGGELVRQVAPTYPQAAKALRLSGTVVLQADVDERGIVANTHVATGNPILAAAAQQAVKQWQYKPLLRDGHPLRRSVTVNIDFHP